MNKFWRVENLDGGHCSTHTSYLAAEAVAKTRARLAPQDTFVLSEAILVFKGDAPAQSVESLARQRRRENSSAVSEVSKAGATS
jgi:hypothetical protein